MISAAKLLLPPSPIRLFTPSLTIRFITNKVIKIKYIFKLYYVMNYIIVKIYNNCKKLNKTGDQSWCKKSKQHIFEDRGSINQVNNVVF
jgi:hypothetical protein